jgi:UDP:flavonoid glycosyltransferase YjiC (YdhE family)
MRILFSANPMFGHFVPMVPLAVTLQERGHEVLVATGPGFGPTVRSYGLDCVGAGRDLTLDDVLGVLPGIFEVAPEEQDRYARPRVFVELRAHNVIDDLTRTVADWGPHLIVREPAELASWAVAEARAMPHVCVNAGAATSAAEWDDVAAPWIRDLGRRVGLDELAAESFYRYGLLAFEPAGYQDWSHTPTARVHRPDPMATEPAPELGLLDLDDRPLVYVTLGTEFFNADLMHSLIAALDDGTRNIVVTTGPQATPADVDPGVPHVVVASWLPQDALLERADLVVSHGGGGTTIGALVRGVPMLCVPQGADQFHHARRVEQLGVGRTLDPGERSPEEIRAVASELLTDPRYRFAAAEVVAATALLPGVEDAAIHLETRFGRTARP